MVEKYVKVMQDTYEDSVTTVRCVVGMTEGFKVEVGLHQGSTLSPFLFAMVMDRLTDEVRKESPWNMMFADEIVIFSESKEQVESLERWRYALENMHMYKGKVYKTVVRPAMLYGLETVPLTKKQEAELAVVELKMLRFSLGVTRMDEIKNKFVRGTAQVRQIGDKVREARLRWYGHVQRRNAEYIGKKMLCLELPDKRRRGRPKTRFLDVVREDMRVVGVVRIGIQSAGEIGDYGSAVANPLMGAAERKRRRRRFFYLNETYKADLTLDITYGHYHDDVCNQQ